MQKKFVCMYVYIYDTLLFLLLLQFFLVFRLSSGGYREKHVERESEQGPKRLPLRRAGRLTG